MATDIRNLPKVLKCSDKAQPTWASDAGRNSNSGKFSGTFVGYFTDLQINFGKCNQSQMTTIKNALQRPIIEKFTYFNTDHGTWETEDFYGTVIDASFDNYEGRYEPFSVSLKGVVTRDDI